MSRTTHKASFVCATFRRPELVCELLYSLLSMEWDDIEIVIVNDEPEQELVFDHPQVRIVNWPRRMSSIGMKRNYGVSQCTGDYIFPVDDDDLYLPHKVRQAVENMSSFGVFKTDLLVLDTSPLEIVRGWFPSNYMFTMGAFAAGGAFDIHDPWGGETRLMGVLDMFMARTGSTCGRITEPSYVYRYHTTDFHASSRTRRASVSDKEMARGKIVLEPRKPAIDITSVNAVDNGKRITDRLPFKPASMSEFYQGIEKGE